MESGEVAHTIVLVDPAEDEVGAVEAQGDKEEGEDGGEDCGQDDLAGDGVWRRCVPVVVTGIGVVSLHSDRVGDMARGSRRWNRDKER